MKEKRNGQKVRGRTQEEKVRVIVTRNKQKKKEKERCKGCPPQCPEEQVVGQLRELVVLHVQHLQLAPLQPIGQRAQAVPANQELPQAAAAQEPWGRNTNELHRVGSGWVEVGRGGGRITFKGSL